MPFVSLIFIAMHWDKCKGPFLKYLVCIPFFILGAILMPGVESA
ncbi:hypothetical protein N8343_02045 [Akkermansiaceae bacterium]|nr:hypothetical protein [Akkermansiaceae bacterium]